MPINKILDYIENENYELLPTNVVTMAKKSLLDFVGSSFAGYQNKASASALKSSKWLGGAGSCTIIGGEKKVSPLAAVFANATLSSCMDIDDGHRQAVGHPACMIIPPVLATGEVTPSCTGKDLITAIVTGYEIGIRCGVVMNSNHSKLFYGSGGWAHFGSAAGASKIKRMTRVSTMHAISIGEVYGPTAQCDKSIAAGSMTKESVGWGAVTGQMGVLLAETGFTGPNNILMDDHLYSDKAKEIFQTLGEIYEIERTYFKEYPACKWAHSPITAAQLIKKEFNPNLKEIDEIIIETFSKALTLDHVSPQTSEAAQYSIPFTVATAFHYGNVEPYHVSEEYLNNEAVYEVAKKIRLKQVDDLEEIFPEKRPARLKVKMINGEVFEKEVHIVKGDAENPLTWDELVEKFEMCTNNYITHDRQLQIIDQIKNLENLSDLREFTSLLRP